VCSGFESIRAVAEDGKEERGGQPVAQEGGEAHPRRGEPFDGHEGSLRLGQPFDEVRGRGDRGGEPVAQPPDLVLGVENRPVQVDRGAGNMASVPNGAPVDEFCFRDGEANTQAGPPGLQHRVIPL